MTKNITFNPDFYRLRTEYLAPDEAAFFQVLTKLLKREFFVCPKVALSDLFFVIRPNENVQYASRLIRKNVDFLLLWNETLKPALAIELDHLKQTENHREEDFLDAICQSTGLPLIHITIHPPYDINLLLDKIHLAIKNSKIITPADTDFSPICPRCGITMVLRFDKDGPIKGRKYYGCLNFPACQESIDVDD